MATKSNRSGAGGGPKSRQVTERPVRTGTPRRGVSPAGVSQIGSSMGNHVTELGSKMKAKGGSVPLYGGKAPVAATVPLGNATALTAGQGPGAGRTVRVCGSQGQQGSANPGQPTPGANKPIFPGFK